MHGFLLKNTFQIKARDGEPTSQKATHCDQKSEFSHFSFQNMLWIHLGPVFIRVVFFCAVWRSQKVSMHIHFILLLFHPVLYTSGWTILK